MCFSPFVSFMYLSNVKNDIGNGNETPLSHESLIPTVQRKSIRSFLNQICRSLGEVQISHYSHCR